MRSRSTRRAAPMAFAVLALLAGACGEEESGETAIIRTADGVQVISAEEAAQVTSAAAADEGGAAEGESAAGEAAGDPGSVEGGAADGASSDEAFDDQTASTVAVDDDRSPDERMFDAFNEFRGCLEERGTQFIGAPDASGEGPTNDPAYVESLSICAQQSDIVAVMQEAQDAAEDLTPEEVEERNEGVLDFVDCMESRGWTVEMTTGDNGMLQPSGFSNPNGEDVFSTSDLEDCAAESERENTEEG